MYKRYARELKKTADDSSSDSENDVTTLAYPKENRKRRAHDEEASNSDSSFSEVEDISASGDLLPPVGEEAVEAEEEEDVVISRELLTVEELEAGDAKKPTKPRRGQELVYECSICPEKVLTTLKEVQAHIESKVCYTLRPTDQRLFQFHQFPP